MKKLLSYCFYKWWILPLSSVVLIGLSFVFDSVWFLIISIILIIVSVIYQFIKKGWKLGCLNGLIMLIILFISVMWFVLQLFPGPEKIHKKYSKRYENRAELQKILGVEIPGFTIVDSRLKHFNYSDFEFNVHCTIGFKTLPDDKFFYTLDSICALTVPDKPDENSSYFYYGLESVYSCWSKKGNKYSYVRNTDFGDKILHSRDAYLYFNITKGSKTAEIVYGNY